MTRPSAILNRRGRA